MISLSKIMRGGRAFYLAYDQGIERGPSEFNDVNVNPLNIIRIAKLGGFNGLIVQKGIADRYRKEIRKSRIPLIIKLNGKTNLVKGEPISRQLCTVKEALKLGAKAVGYTIYIGSKYESVMLEEFEDIFREAHKNNVPAIAWIYPRGKSIKGKSERELMAYSARAGLEIDADIIKIKYDGTPGDLKWAVKAAGNGRVKVVVAGGAKTNERTFIKNVKDIMKAGAAGVAVGRNIWKSKNPIELSRKIRRIVFNKNNPISS